MSITQWMIARDSAPVTGIARAITGAGAVDAGKDGGGEQDVNGGETGKTNVAGGYATYAREGNGRYFYRLPWSIGAMAYPSILAPC
jgi:hypothetical protein